MTAIAFVLTLGMIVNCIGWIITLSHNQEQKRSSEEFLALRRLEFERTVTAEDAYESGYEKAKLEFTGKSVSH